MTHPHQLDILRDELQDDAFQHLLRDARGWAWPSGKAQLRFRKLGINLDGVNAEELWSILDADDSGAIDEDSQRPRTVYEKRGARERGLRTQEPFELPEV